MLMDEIVMKGKVETTLTGSCLRALDQLIERGIFMKRQDAIRQALRNFFRIYGIDPFSKFVEETE